MAGKGVVPSWGKGGFVGGPTKGFQKGGSKGGREAAGKVWQLYGKWNDSPVGRGFQGYCVSCGELGHTATECPGATMGAKSVTFGSVETEPGAKPSKQECSIEIGRVWNVGAVGRAESKLIGDRFLTLAKVEEGDEEGEEEEPEIEKQEVCPHELVDSSGEEGHPTLERVMGFWANKEKRVESPPDIPKGFERVTRKKWKKFGCQQGCACRGPAGIRAFEGTAFQKTALGFQVADVKKPLLVVYKTMERGNQVGLGKAKEDNFIINKNTGDKLLLRPSGRGSSILDVKFLNGKASEITVDSGAEENVCPRD